MKPLGDDAGATEVLMSEWAWVNVLNAKERRWLTRRLKRGLCQVTQVSESAHMRFYRSIAGIWKEK